MSAGLARESAAFAAGDAGGMDVAGLVAAALVAVGTMAANRLTLSRGLHRDFLLSPSGTIG